MITETLKKQVVTAIQQRRKVFQGSDTKYAVSLGINNAVLSRILKRGETDKILSDQNWITLARMLNVTMGKQREWRTAVTPVFTFVNQVLDQCQTNSNSAIICDGADVGKTYAAKDYCTKHPGAVYIDCSQYKHKARLIRQIAREFGVGHTGRYNDVYEDLVFYLRVIANPIIILDEAGDLDYAAFLELKALWNATERCCGWVMMGADGLQEKINRAINYKKVGYTELFSRFGKRYLRVTPDGRAEQQQFVRLQAALIIKANAPESTDVQKMIHSTDGSLRRIYTEITKLN
jgi:hypothetical protein